MTVLRYDKAVAMRRLQEYERRAADFRAAEPRDYVQRTVRGLSLRNGRTKPPSLDEQTMEFTFGETGQDKPDMEAPERSPLAWVESKWFVAALWVAMIAIAIFGGAK